MQKENFEYEDKQRELKKTLDEMKKLKQIIANLKQEADYSIDHARRQYAGQSRSHKDIHQNNASSIRVGDGTWKTSYGSKK